MQFAPSLRNLILSACLVCSILLFLSCRSTTTGPTNNSASQELVVLQTPPFSTKEPDRYQAVRTITSITKGIEKPIVTRTTISRNGGLRREDYETAPGQKLVYLDLPSGRFVLYPAAKLFAMIDGAPEGTGLQALAAGDISADLLLNEAPTETRYANLGAEAVGNRGAIKYRVLTRSTVTNASNEGETLIWIDDGLKIPLRWQTTAKSADSETTTTMELTDITQQVDEHAFQIPTDYRQVNIGELTTPAGRKPARQR